MRYATRSDGLQSSPRCRGGLPVGFEPVADGPLPGAGGTVTAYDEATGEVTLEVFVKNDRDEVLTPGVITAQLEQER